MSLGNRSRLLGSQDNDPDLITLLKKLRYDLTAAQGKITDLLNLAATLPLETTHHHRCNHCGLAFRGPLTLTEHLYYSHNGPVPDHYNRIEQMTADPDATLQQQPTPPYPSKVHRQQPA